MVGIERTGDTLTMETLDARGYCIARVDIAGKRDHLVDAFSMNI